MAKNKLSAFDPKLLSGFRGDSEKRETSSYIHDKDRLANWDKRYIELAAHVAAWSKDPDARVGCVIVSPTYGRAVTFSFNGFPTNVTDSLEHLHHEDEDEKLDRIPPRRTECAALCRARGQGMPRLCLREARLQHLRHHADPSGHPARRGCGA